MPRRVRKILPSHFYCQHCRKDSYDGVGIQLALDHYSRFPKRGWAEPKRYYPCPVSNSAHPRYHLTSKELSEVTQRVA